ncbi:MAG: hypothetical protein ING29_10560 [Azospirillum sp.]|nr:hypothetical protein [Azospirillum sp.]
MKPLVVYARDPGAANMTIAAVAALDARPRGPVASRLAVHFGIGDSGPAAAAIFARGPAAAAWTVAGRTPEAPSGAPAALGAACGLLTGLDDVDDPTPRALWRAARAARVPSAAMCDNDVNLAVRLRDPQGGIAPDLMLALSEKGRAEILAAGVPDDRVIVVENVHLARFADRRRHAEARRAWMRARWGVAPAREVWLYAGVVRREMVALRPTDPDDEVETLRALVARLAREGSNAYLVVRPHPRDPEGKYAAGFDPAIAAIETREGDSFDALAGADVVVSLSEAIVEEARALGKRIVDTKPET